MKPWFKSKTMWVSLLSVVSGTATWIAGRAEAGLPITAAGVVFAILRLATKDPIGKE